MSRSILVLIAALTPVSFNATPSGAAWPRCDGDFQLVHGSWVSTRYCRAEQIASVARESGMNVTAETILRNPARADIRVQPARDQVHAFFGLAF